MDALIGISIGVILMWLAGGLGVSLVTERARDIFIWPVHAVRHLLRMRW